MAEEQTQPPSPKQDLFSGLTMAKPRQEEEEKTPKTGNTRALADPTLSLVPPPLVSQMIEESLMTEESVEKESQNGDSAPELGDEEPDSLLGNVESSCEPTEEIKDEVVEAEENEVITDNPLETTPAADPDSSPTYGFFSGWFGSKQRDLSDESPDLQPELPAESGIEAVKSPEGDALAKDGSRAEESHSSAEAPASIIAGEVSVESLEETVDHSEAPESAPETTNEDTIQEILVVSEREESLKQDDGHIDSEPKMPPMAKMDEADQEALEDAFRHQESINYKTAKARPRGLGIVHPNTPIPNSDVALRLLRRFAYKTRPKIITTYGGSKPRSILGYLFGSSKDDLTFVPYRELMDIIFDEGEDREIGDDSDRLVDGILGGDGDSMERARLAVAAFVYLFSVWGHASSRFFEKKDKKSQQAFSELMSVSFSTASDLVAHGCLDGVQIGMGDGGIEYYRAINMMAQSVFSADLTIERNELTAMKFLLSTGCRVSEDSGDALLRGSHLLQTIRTLYHIYLTTESDANKVTARAALQQLVTSAFARVVRADSEQKLGRTSDHFPSEDHRDAFLVLRSICKLSMRNLPHADSGAHSHFGLQTSGSSDTWDGNRDGTASLPRRADGKEFDSLQREHAQLLYTSAIHPALESKLLALELILYVLQRTEFSKGFIQRSGSQFHAAIRNYLCVSLLKNCTSDNTRVVNLSLRIFVPVVRSFRGILKNEIEAFVTNVFFVILDSKNTPAEHKSIVVRTFEEICSDPTTLAEIFLNYDCDLSAVDLFHRIVNTLSKVSRTGLQEPKSGAMSLISGSSAARLEKFRNENRELRLDAMRALRQVLASLHASIVEPMNVDLSTAQSVGVADDQNPDVEAALSLDEPSSGPSSPGAKHNLVEIYGSKKKRRAEEAEIVLRFNQKPSAGIAYAGKCGHIDVDDPIDVARYLLKSKDSFEKTQIGEYLGREAEYQNGFSLKVLHEYVRLMDFTGLSFDDAIRFFLSGFRLPGEAQKIDRIMEKFAERFVEQNPDAFPTADVAFILAFSIIMLNTDLHNPAIKEERRMTKEGFIRNNRGICDGQDLPEELLCSIFDRIKENPISLKEDDEARERVGDGKSRPGTGLPAALSPASFFSSHYDDLDRARESNFQKERDHIVRTTESLLKRRRHGQDIAKSYTKSRTGKITRAVSSKFVRTEDSGLRDEYVSPMFEVAWGPALAAFSTAMESANGTVGALISIASDEELELAAENAAETIEVCLTGFRFAIGTAGLCGNETARDAFMLALSRFSQLGTGALLEPRHIRCIQTMLSLAREDGELLGNSWGHVFRALSEINRFHQLFHLMARNDRVAAAAAERRRRRIESKERKREERLRRKAAAEDGESVGEGYEDETMSEADDSLAESDLFSDDEIPLEEYMDAKAIDEANAREVYEAVSETLIERIYERSSSLSAPALKDFVAQLCMVSKVEISVGKNGSKADLTQVSYRHQHELLNSSSIGQGIAHDQFHHKQPNIYNLQKLVEVTHYNMHSRPRMIFADLWNIVAEHLTNTALHSNPAIAMYAVDSFRQLSIQYLKRDELEVFEFQRRFLKPLEIVMSRSAQASTKDLILGCVDRIIHVFKADSTGVDDDGVQKGGLRSGWLTLLNILGTGGCDSDADISRTSFRILTEEVHACLEDSSYPGILLIDHFNETVNTLFLFMTGPHADVCVGAAHTIVRLADYLGDANKKPPNLSRRNSHLLSTDDGCSKKVLELWWPILLGLSRSVGDERLEVRSSALESLLQLINRHFISIDGDCSADVQTLQLIFRGVLAPILEYAESSLEEGSTPQLPVDLESFLYQPQDEVFDESVGAVEEQNFEGWLETTFDPFINGCVEICVRVTNELDDDSLVDEIFAILNSCLLSDSGRLAVKGLRRLEQFVSSDISAERITDDLWATVSHMLRKCFTVRNLPPEAPQEPNEFHVTEETTDDEKQAFDDEKQRYESELDEYRVSVKEFETEDKILQERRYIYGNTAMVVGSFLSSDKFAVGLRWHLFLMFGLAKGIVDWDRADLLVRSQHAPSESHTQRPPEFIESSMYGRKWMNSLILKIAAIPEVVEAPIDADPKVDIFFAGKKLICEETRRLLTAFLRWERAASQYRPLHTDVVLYKRFTSLVTELLNGLNSMTTDHLMKMDWISPILLSSCIQFKNEDIRLLVQKLVQRTSPVPSERQKPYPSPIQLTPSEEAAEEEDEEYYSDPDYSDDDEDDDEDYDNEEESDEEDTGEYEDESPEDAANVSWVSETLEVEGRNGHNGDSEIEGRQRVKMYEHMDDFQAEETPNAMLEMEDDVEQESSRDLVAAEASESSEMK